MDRRVGAAMAKLYATDFEVFGKVQGVFFRKHTEAQAKKLGLHGWCMNTTTGTVKGEIEGPLEKINQMKTWLRETGSPKSRIDKANFSEAKEIPQYSHKSFVIRR
ncbi:acylphosphatase-2-like [Teleopsis dalmanni]|nr:acylphosphatase-2-like [Teleopsis dalmanni]XP_037953592.1 acylphosphatase-2-like [Teleopsis dalmanni]